MDNRIKVFMSHILIDSISGSEFIGQPVSFDQDINDCLLYMYFYMMSGDEKYYQEFDEKYEKLNDEQKEFVKNDYINIINAQDEKDKVKRKGEMNYE